MKSKTFKQQRHREKKQRREDKRRDKRKADHAGRKTANADERRARNSGSAFWSWVADLRKRGQIGGRRGGKRLPGDRKPS
jgi:hypothetical protein